MFQNCPALVLNADFQPLSYFPLSLFGWEDAIKAVVRGSHVIVAEYDQVVRSPSTAMRLPSVIALREYVRPPTRVAFTRFNVFLRDHFVCQYCAIQHRPNDLTFDHVLPRAAGGVTSWENIATSVQPLQYAQGHASGETPPEAVRANGASAYGRATALPA